MGFATGSSIQASLTLKVECVPILWVAIHWFPIPINIFECLKKN